MRKWLAIALLALGVAGCSPASQDLLSNVHASAPPASPDLRALGNRIDVQYLLGSPARFSATIVAPDGQRWSVYEDVERPIAGTYRLALDGTVPGPGANERRVLPDGDYRIVLKAESAAESEETEVPFPIRGADTQAPAIEGLSIFPEVITPNFDADADVARVNYRVTKKSRTFPFADRVFEDGRRVRAWTGEERRIEAGEQRLQWDGTLASLPLPDGRYEFGIRAEDDAGNITEARTDVSLEAGGTPDARIVEARITPRQIIRGSEVCLDAIVRNTGQTVLRTQGPPPSYVYNSLDTFSSIENHQNVEQAGYWRVGLDWAGANSTVGARYPWRWGLGKDLAPGEEAAIRGCVKVNNEQTRMVFFASLIQENVAIRDGGTAMAEIRVSP